MSNNKIPTQLVELPIPGSDFTLTPFRESDVSALHAILSLSEVSDPLVNVPRPYTSADARWWVSTQVALAEKLLKMTSADERSKLLFSQEFGMPMQVIRCKGVFVGCCTLTPVKGEEGKVEIGYYLSPDHQRKGVMGIAAREVLRIGASEWGVTRVFSSADDENLGSRKLLSRLVEDEGMRNVKKGRKKLKWPAGKYSLQASERWSETWEWEVN